MKRRLRAPALAVAALLLVPACDGGSLPASAREPPAPPAPPDTTPPVASARPPGGTYATVQYVTLAADEVATVYWSGDGTAPSPGAPGTRSGPAPLFWIRVGPGTTTLTFYAQDAAGNRSATVTETYQVTAPSPP